MNPTLPVSAPVGLPLHGTFSGHETFTFRYGWLKKGIEGILRRPELFQAEDAMAELGVGKNMVRSIRHWCLATTVLEEGDTLPNSRTRKLTPSALGNALFVVPGYDQFLEDDGSLWLLHWHLATNASKATTWYWAFNLCREQDFTRESLQAALKRMLDERGWGSVSEGSLKADIACFLRTYAPGKRGVTSTLEETLDCPLTNLNLIADTGDDGRFRFVNGHKSSLPTAIFAFALLDFWGKNFVERETLSLRQIVYAEGSPGRVFRLDDDAVLRHLDRLDTLTGGRLRFSDTIQQRQVARLSTIEKEEILDAYYAV